MRGFTFPAGAVCFVAFASGCFLMKGEIKQTEAAPRTPTHAYWNGASIALAHKPVAQDLNSMLDAVRKQTDALRKLSADDVDEELVAAVDEVITCEEDVLRLAAVTGDLSLLRKNKEMALAFQMANKKAADAKKRLRALLDPLNERHGGGFAPLAG